MSRKFMQNSGKQRRERIGVFFLAAAVTIGLAACGINTAGDKKDASGSAVEGVSGSAVESISGSAVEQTREVDFGLTSFSNKALANSTNEYMDFLYDDDITIDMDGLVQYTRDGKEIKKYTFSKNTDEDTFYDFHLVTDDSLIYSILTYDGKKEKKAFYELSLKKDKDGNDILNPKQSKKLFEVVAKDEESVDDQCAYVDEKQIVFLTNQGRCFHYDRTRDKLSEEQLIELKKKSYEYCVEMLWGKITDKKLFFTVCSENPDKKSGLYSYDLRNKKVKKLTENMHIAVPEETQILGTFEDHALFYDMSQYEVLLYHEADESISKVFSEEKIKNYLKGRNLFGEYMDSEITNLWMGAWQDRCFIEVSLFYADKNHTSVTTCPVLFSIEFETGNLQYEKKITEAILTKGIFKHMDVSEVGWYSNPPDALEEEIVQKEYKIIRSKHILLSDICDGQLLICLDTKKGQYECELFDLATGRVTGKTINEIQLSQFSFDYDRKDKNSKVNFGGFSIYPEDDSDYLDYYKDHHQAEHDQVSDEDEIDEDDIDINAIDREIESHIVYEEDEK